MLRFLATQWPHLIPTGLQAAQAVILLTIAAGLTAIGAALRVAGGGERTAPQADLLVGWSVAVSAYVVVGSFTAIPFSALLAPTGAVMAMAVAFLAYRRESLPLGGGRVLVLLLPLLAVTLSMGPSENDDLTQWLPNLRYLMLFDHFPGPGLPASDSVFPSYPYALTLVGWAVGKLTGGIAETAADKFNLLLLGSLALMLIEEFRGTGPGKRPGWGAAAMAVAAVTLLSPTFVIKLVLSNYADCATGVALAFAAVLAGRALDTEERPGRGLTIQMAAAFAILILIKQANLGLLLLALGGLALWVRRTPLRLARLLPALAAAAVAYLAWRHQVQRLGGGEMAPTPFAQWQFAVLPETFASIGHVVVNKGGYFGLALTLCLAAVPVLRRRPSPGMGAVAAFPAAFLGFTLFLIWVYLAVYIGYEGRSAASFWRYHTQLGGLEAAAAATVAGSLWRRSGRQLPALAPRLLAGACLAIVLAGPVIAAREVRFDIHPVKIHVQAAARDIAQLVPAGRLIEVVDHQGPAFFGMYLDYFLGFGRQVTGTIGDSVPPAQVADALDKSTADYAYVLTWTPAVETALGQQLKPGASHLLEKAEPGHWRLVKSWPFAGFGSPTEFKY